MMQKMVQWGVGQLRRWSRSRKYVDMILGDQDLSELAKGSGIAFAFKVLSLPLGLATSLIISRRYGAEAVGLYGLMTTVMGIVVSVGMLGLGSAMPRFLGEVRAKQTGDEQAIYRTSVRILVVSGLILSPLLYFVAPWLSEIVFSESKLLFPLQVASLFLLPMMRGGYNLSYLLAAKKIYWSELISGAIGPIFMFLFVFGSYWFWPTYYIPVWGWLLGSLITLGASLYILWKEDFVAIRGNLFEWRKIMKVSGPMLITGMMGMIVIYTDTFMLGIFGTTSDVGVYRIVFSLVSLVVIGLNFLTPIVGPIISEQYRSNKLQKLQNIIFVVSFCIGIIGIIVFLILFLFPEDILSIFGKEFIQGASSLRILSFSYLISSLTSINGFFMNNCGYEKQMIAVALVTSIFNILLNWLMIPSYGIIGASIATGATFIITNIILTLYIYRKTKVLVLFPFQFLTKAIIGK